MSQLISDRPEIRKMLHSIQCAFPVQEDPWRDLSVGIGLSEEEISEVWNQLVEEKIILGLRLEIDPQHPEYSEWLVPSTEKRKGFLTRCHLESDDLSYFSILQSFHENEAPDYAEYAWPSINWKKVGTFLHTKKQSAENLLSQMTERSYKVDDRIYQQNLPISDDQRATMESLSAALPINGNEPVWKQIGRHLNITNMDVVRSEISKILLTKRARRFHAVLNPVALGYKAASLVGWNIEEYEAGKAATALSFIRSSADVVVRKSTPKFPCTLSSLLIAPDHDTLKKIKSSISDKWGINPVMDQELNWHPATLS